MNSKEYLLLGIQAIRVLFEKLSRLLAVSFGKFKFERRFLGSYDL